ncbi:MAG: cytochrome c biogenesis protein CcdA [Anaerolineales bacterium]|nr:cytochrome c biogenesis protein CcdA [Anaerolineales bacterium]
MDLGSITLSPYGVGISALAGLLSFLSPCVLALVPAYIGYLGGRSVTPSGEVVDNRWVTFSHGLAFVLGFSIIFVILGAAASALGALLYDLRTILAKVGGIVVIIFGLHTTGLITIPFLDYDTRRQTRPDPGLGYLSSALMGVFFSAGWAPCVGPVLGAVLTLALTGGEILTGVVLLSAYSIGLAVPFLLAALGVGRVAELMSRYGKAVRYLSIATGIILVIVGVLLFTGTLETLARFGFFVDFGL